MISFQENKIFLKWCIEMEVIVTKGLSTCQISETLALKYY